MLQNEITLFVFSFYVQISNLEKLNLVQHSIQKFGRLFYADLLKTSNLYILHIFIFYFFSHYFNDQSVCEIIF